VSRLCVATADAGTPGPLTVAVQSGRFQRLYLVADPATGTELAIAAPGLDEPGLIADLVTAIHTRVAQAPGSRRPAIAGFHVGLAQLVDDGFQGKGPDRVLALVRHPAIREASARALARAGATPALAVAITAGLFEELRPDGLPGHGWAPVPPADAWLTLWDGFSRAARESRRG
jgi:hypothetical protein